MSITKRIISVWGSLLLYLITGPMMARAVVEADLPGHSLFLHITGWASPFPGPGDYTIDFAASGHDYSIVATGAVTSATGTWSFRQGDLFGSVVITLDNYFGNGTGAEIALLSDAYYELYAGNANQHGNWSFDRFLYDPIISQDLVDMTAPENGFATFSVSLLKNSSGASFQWFKDGLPLAGATRTSLSLSHLDKSMEGLYSVHVVQNGSTNSSREARLTVVPPRTATFNGQTFEMVLPNNTSPPGLPPADAANAFKFKSPTQVEWNDGELVFLSDYSGAGTNKNKGGFGLFAVSNGVPRNLVLSTDLMPGAQAPYLSISGFGKPADGKFLFNAVAKSLSGTLNYAMMEWDGETAVPYLAAKTPIPGNESQQFQYFGIPGGSGLNAVFSGYGPGTTAGFYQFQNGKPVSLLDNNTVLPEFPAPPMNLDAGIVADTQSGNTVFALRERNTATFGGFLRKSDGTFRKLLDGNTAYPGTTKLMKELGSAAGPKLSGDTAVFLMRGENLENYVVSADSQGLHPIAQTGDILPGGVAEIANINNIGITASGIVFEATAADQRTGVYLSHDGQISPVVDPLSKVGTNIVTSVRMQAASETNLVLAMTLSSGASGLLVNTAPVETVPAAPARLNPAKTRLLEDGRFSISGSGASGHIGVLERSSDLAAWTSVITNILSEAESEFIDPNPSLSKGFYRLRDTQP